MVYAPVAENGSRWRSELLRYCERDRGEPGFLAGLARRLRRVVDFDASFLVATDPGTTLPTPPVLLDGVEEDCRRFWERELLVDDVMAYRDLARRPVPVDTMRLATGGDPERSTRHRELNTRNGFHDELRMVFRIGSSSWGVGSLWRSGGSPHFTAGDVAAIAELSAPIGRAFRRVVLGTGLPDRTGWAAPGLLKFDAAGTLESLNEEAAPLMAEIHPGVGGVVQCGIPIPTEVSSVVSQARAMALGHATGPARARIRSRKGRWLVVHASCLRDGEGGHGGTAVVIEQARVAEMTPIIVEAYELTGREREVTGMIARGMSTGEIARALRISTHTVRGHVKSVFAKIGVGSRGELVAKLFANHYYTELHSG